MKKLAIFDLDGTLLNTLDDLAAACNHALSGCGLPEHPVDAYRQMIGNGVRLLIQRAVPVQNQGDETLLEKLHTLFRDYYNAHGSDLTRPYDGILQMLDELRDAGMTLTVLSNKPHAFTKELVPHYFGDRFAHAFGQREGYPPKPDGALVAELLRLTGYTAAETVYIGDSGVDMQTAHNGGVDAVGVLWGFRDRQELEQNGAVRFAETPHELQQLLLSL